MTVQTDPLPPGQRRLSAETRSPVPGRATLIQDEHKCARMPVRYGFPCCSQSRIRPEVKKLYEPHSLVRQQPLADLAGWQLDSGEIPGLPGGPVQCDVIQPGKAIGIRRGYLPPPWWLVENRVSHMFMAGNDLCGKADIVAMAIWPAIGKLGGDAERGQQHHASHDCAHRAFAGQSVQPGTGQECQSRDTEENVPKVVNREYRAGRQQHGRRNDQPGKAQEHTSELQSQSNLVCRLLLEK